MKSFIFLLLFTLVQLASAQDCHNDLVVSQSVLKRQGVKKVSIYEVDTATQKKFLHFEFFLHPNGSVYKTVRHAPGGDKRGIAECSCTKDSLEYISNTFVEDKAGKKTPMEKRIMTYNKNRQLIKRTQETFEGNHLLHITHFNLADPNETNIEVVTFEGNDTIRRVKQKKNKAFEESVFREKTVGGWQTRKYVSNFVDGKLASSEEYLDGKLIKTRKVENKEDDEGPLGYDHDEHGLPSEPREVKKTDRVEIKKLQKYYQPFGHPAFSSKPLIRTQRFADKDAKKPFQEDIYYGNGLLFVSHSIELGYFSLHEYEFYR